MLRKANLRKPEIEAVLLPDYGKRKLLNYADTFRDLARTFTYIPEDRIKDNEERDSAENADRQEVICRRKILENQGILAEQLNEVAKIMTHVAEETFCYVKISEKKKKHLVQILKSHGIWVHRIYMIENASGHLEVSIRMRTVKEKHFSTTEIAGLISVLFNKRLVPARNCLIVIKNEPETYVFEEEARFGVLTGVAKAVKENEEMSGDNYTFMERNGGSFICALSDGMGSGEKACQDSGIVVDLLEKLLEAGFSRQTAIQMINGALITQGEEQNMSTLDLCEFDLYTGVGSFLKVGAAPSFIKKEFQVETVEADNLPLGIFQQLELEEQGCSIGNGEYIIMLSDGVMDAFESEDAFYRMQDFIGRLQVENPREIANHILQYVICAANGKIQDDMTVVVAGLWENNRQC